MPSYYLNEAVIDLPERPFTDKTIHGLESKLAGGETLGVLVHRRPSEGKSLRDLVDENVALNGKRLLGYSVLEDKQALLDGVPAVLLRTQWHKDKLVFVQLQAHVVFGGLVMIFAVSGPLPEQAACEETFESILSTLTWRSE